MNIICRVLQLFAAAHLSLAVFLVASAPAKAADPPSMLCDAQITRPTSDSFGYKLRGDRCEGTFEQPTSAAGTRQVALISLTCGPPPAAFSSRGPTAVGWADLGNSSVVSLRIETLPEVSLRYRLDARSAATPSSFSWSSELISALRIKPRELSLLVIGTAKLGDIPMPGTAVLASFGDKTATQCTKAPQAHFYTRFQLSEFRVCAKELSATKDASDSDRAMCETYAGPHVPSESIVAPLRMLAGKKGLFELSVVTTRVGGQRQDTDRFKVVTQ